MESGPGNSPFLEVAAMVVTWWIAAFLCSEVDFSNNKNMSKVIEECIFIR